MLALVIYVVRRRHTLSTMPEPMQTTPESDRRAQRAVGAAMVMTVVLLFIMMVGSFVTGHALGSMNQRDRLHHRCVRPSVVVGSSLPE